MKKIHVSEKGQILVLLVLVLIGLLGFTALAVDGGMIYADRRFMQSAADAASIAGAGAVGDGVEDLDMKYEEWSCTGLDTKISSAYDVTVNKALANDFTISWKADLGTGSNNGVLITCNDTEKYVDVMVMLTRDTNTSFVHLISLVTGGTLIPMRNTVTSISRIEPGITTGNGASIVALRTNPISNSDVCVTVTGTSDVVLIDGGIWSNCALTMTGNSSVEVDGGNITYNIANYPYTPPSSGTVSPEPTTTDQLHPITEHPIIIDGSAICNNPTTDPYNNVSQHNPTGTTTLNPGNYGRITLTDGKIILNKGLYCINDRVSLNGGEITVNTNSDGDPIEGVTLYFTGSNFTINGGVHVVLTAGNMKPTNVTDYAGTKAIEDLLLYVPPSENPDIDINGNSGSIISGTIYAPSSYIYIGGTTNLDSDSGEEFNITSSIIGLDVAVKGTPGLNIRYDADFDYSFPTYLQVRK